MKTSLKMHFFTFWNRFSTICQVTRSVWAGHDASDGWEENSDHNHERTHNIRADVIGGDVRKGFTRCTFGSVFLHARGHFWCVLGWASGRYRVFGYLLDQCIPRRLNQYLNPCQNSGSIAAFSNWRAFCEFHKSFGNFAKFGSLPQNCKNFRLDLKGLRGLRGGHMRTFEPKRGQLEI